MNRTYSQNAEAFIKEGFALTDAELTLAYNVRFGVNLTRAAIRKKRQRLGLPKSAVDIRMAWCRLIGMCEDELADSLTCDPPRDIAGELSHLAAALRLNG